MLKNTLKIGAGVLGIALLTQIAYNEVVKRYESKSKELIVNNFYLNETKINGLGFDITRLFVLDMDTKDFLKCTDTTGDYRFNKISVGTRYQRREILDKNSAEFYRLNNVCNAYRNIFLRYEGVKV